MLVEIDPSEVEIVLESREIGRMIQYATGNHRPTRAGVLSFLGRYETFEADARHVASILAPDRSIVLPHRNRGAPRGSQPSRKAREAVWAKYEADYRTFGYPFV